MSTTLPTTEAEKQAFFANIVAQYSERLYWTVRRIVIDHDDADEVEAADDGEGREHGEEEFDGAHGKALGEGEVAVASHGDNGAAEEHLDGDDDGRAEGLLRQG